MNRISHVWCALVVLAMVADAHAGLLAAEADGQPNQPIEGPNHRGHRQ